MRPIELRVERLDHAAGLQLPEYQTPGSSGMDLRAAVGEAAVIESGCRALIPTGLRIEIPAGYEGQVRTRSGLAASRGVAVLNSPGTIDADYRGEVKVILINLGSEPYRIERGARIAQMVIQPVVRARLFETDDLGETARGAGGFGSSGGI
jgi:dUTP pyrophosphatase